MEIKTVSSFKCLINADKDGKFIRVNKNNVEYMFCDFNDTSGVLGRQASRQTKIVDYKRLPVIFDALVEELKRLAKAPSPKIKYDESIDNYVIIESTTKSVEILLPAEGAFYTVAVAPYYSVSADGEIFIMTTGANAGKPYIKSSVSFFCFPCEGPMEVLERTTYNLPWVEVTDNGDVLPAETDEEVSDTTAAADTTKKGRRS